MSTSSVPSGPLGEGNSSDFRQVTFEILKDSFKNFYENLVEHAPF